MGLDSRLAACRAGVGAGVQRLEHPGAQPARQDGADAADGAELKAKRDELQREEPQ